MGIAAVAAIFISNLPEGLSSAAGMKKAGRTPIYIFALWTSIAIVSGVAAFLGYTLCKNVSPGVMAAMSAVAGGAIMAMLVETMIPEAFEGTRNLAGLEACAGFLVSFAITVLAE